MGLCSSENLDPEDVRKKKDEKKQNRKLEEVMLQDHSEDQATSKVLLLGGGDSGKSTLFKQMILIYGAPFTIKQRMEYRGVIYNNVMTSIKTLCEMNPEYGSPIADTNETHREMIENLTECANLTPAIVVGVQALWSDPGIQACYTNRSRFTLNDSTKYYFERLDELVAPDYCPDAQDCLRSRAPTTGIVENSFSIEGNEFKIFDVGGQRSERKKWINCFESVTAVLFVAALSAYDQNLYEDAGTNRMDESLTLFEEISNSVWFEKTAIILFLNKKDIFLEKLQITPLSHYQPEYKGDDSFDDACHFVKGQFEARHHESETDIYTHITCATDTDHIRVVFGIVRDIVIKEGLHRAGLM